MTETFPAITPSVNTKQKKTYRVLKATFGDGYTQRAVDGLNATRQEWDVVWQQLTEADADTITDFLDAREGADAFFWTTPLGPTLKFNNPGGYNKVSTFSTHSTITARFVQQYDL